jgi:hypothetical protein
MNRTRWSLGLLLALVAFPCAVAAQDADSRLNTASSERFQVVGTVVDRQTGEPVPGTLVEFRQVGVDGEPAWTGHADELGRFVTPPLPVGGYEIGVDALSYSSFNHIEIFPDGAVMDLRVEVVRVDYQLEPLVVTVRRPNRLERTGYYNRQQSSVGHFVGLAEIQARQPYEVSDLFRTIPGARVTPPGGLGMGSGVALRGGCSPQLVIDGVALTIPAQIDMLFHPSDLEAIEVYHGPTAPIEYNARSTCGTIMVWTRNPPEPTGHNISFKKLLVIVGFATLAVTSTSR